MKRSEPVELLHKLGEGAYGSVYKARRGKTGEFVAIKTIRMTADDEGISSTTLREITILNSLSHPNIVKLLSYRIDLEDPKVELIFEFMDNDLAKLMRTAKYQLMPNQVRVH